MNEHDVKVKHEINEVINGREVHDARDAHDAPTHKKSTDDARTPLPERDDKEESEEKKTTR